VLGFAVLFAGGCRGVGQNDITNLRGHAIDHQFEFGRRLDLQIGVGGFLSSPIGVR